MIYQKDSSKAEEFIHHEEILDTLEYAQNNKDNRVLIEQLIEKAALCKGLPHWKPRPPRTPSASASASPIR